MNFITTRLAAGTAALATLLQGNSAQGGSPPIEQPALSACGISFLSESEKQTLRATREESEAMLRVQPSPESTVHFVQSFRTPAFSSPPAALLLHTALERQRFTIPFLSRENHMKERAHFEWLPDDPIPLDQYLREEEQRKAAKASKIPAAQEPSTKKETPKFSPPALVPSSAPLRELFTSLEPTSGKSSLPVTGSETPESSASSSPPVQSDPLLKDIETYYPELLLPTPVPQGPYVTHSPSPAEYEELSLHGRVEKCERPADLPLARDLGSFSSSFRHHWIRMPGLEAGMGPESGRVPGEGYFSEDSVPYFTKTQVNTHEGEGDKQGSSCTPLSSINEPCVRERMIPGTPLGRWRFFTNDCQEFVRATIEECQTPVPAPSSPKE